MAVEITACEGQCSCRFPESGVFHAYFGSAYLSVTGLTFTGEGIR